MSASDCEDGWPERLAQSIVDQLHPHLPDGFDLTLGGSGDSVVVLGTCTRGLIDRHHAAFGRLACQDGVPTSRRRRAEIAVNSLLSGVEDWIARNLALPWPGTIGNIVSLHVVAHDDVVEAWFGDEAAPVFPKIRAAID